ncbi:MAG TPA: HAMP domain-containing sensor histidine kinase [Ktedonobacteraceae bacterium]|nr:HAMP domain-containing sensor histidine kinase [Ktedonobacteraceae bacterium]
MLERFSFPSLGLRTKLALSYLAVALSAILVLVIVVSIAVQNYFYTAQRDQLRSSAESYAQQIGQLYQRDGSNWSNVPPIDLYGPDLFIVIDQSGNAHSGRSFHEVAQEDFPAINQALEQALQGHEMEGSLQGSAGDSNAFSGPYISVPIYDNGQTNGHIVGALLLAEPNQYPRGFSPYEFLANVDQIILIAGAVIAVGAVIFSLLLARRLASPLVSLTAAAEQMKNGDYSQRVEPPKSQDEIGALASSFNAMAARIEADVNELRRQEQVRRDLVANIAHDLITPLTAIQGFSEALADDVIADPKSRQETAQLIGREVQRLRRMVRDMQQMSSLETGRVSLDIAPLNLQSLVDETLAVIGPECEQAGIAVYNEIAPTTPPVLADSDRITQVLLNLLDNARRHTPSGGKIIIGASIDASEPSRQQGTPAGHSRWLTIWVSDTGVGIGPVDLPYIFDRFFRIDRSRTGSSGGGSGLGLSIVKAIITAHGGTIWAESTPGMGTRISFTLPIAIKQPQNQEQNAAVDLKP